MRAKVYSKIGGLYFEIHEEEIDLDDIDRILDEWKYADLIEIFNDIGELVYTHENY